MSLPKQGSKRTRSQRLLAEGLRILTCDHHVHGSPATMLSVVKSELVTLPAPRSEILLALTAGDTPALGNIWRITAKKTDFYLDAAGPTGDTMHVSLHGPQGNFTGHRFHIKIDRMAVSWAKKSGHFVDHQVPARGLQFAGLQVAENAYQVARLRWRWHLQRPKYRSAAIFGDAPKIGDGQSGRRLGTILNPNSAWDVDLYISYGRPYWPIQLGQRHGDHRMGPLRNGSGLCLTATSVHRAEKMYPSPPGLVPQLPRRDETPNRLTCGGLGPKKENDMYWFIETVTSLELLRDWQATGLPSRSPLGVK